MRKRQKKDKPEPKKRTDVYWFPDAKLEYRVGPRDSTLERERT